jgi:hypothetical protein
MLDKFWKGLAFSLVLSIVGPGTRSDVFSAAGLSCSAVLFDGPPFSLSIVG